MRFATAILLPLSVPALAFPTGWSPDTARYLSEIGRQIARVRQQGAPDRPTCDLSQVVLPTTDEPLAEIPDGQRLLAVTIGRGTQNYTCASSDASETPVARGAVATLFDANCIASNYPQLLNLLPSIALQLGNPPQLSTGNLGSTGLRVTGYHYFSNATTAAFDTFNLGRVLVMKEGAADAPVAAVKGQPNNLSGAVPWLYLTSIPESPSEVKTIYRVNTAGGKPPATCEGQPEDILVQYGTQYWMYG